MKWDKWQQQIIEYKGSLTIRKGRQVGGSTTVGRRAAQLMLEYPNSNTLMIAPSQRQSSQLFIKTMSWLELEHDKAIQAAGSYQERSDVSVTKNMELRRLFEAKHGIFAEIPTKSMCKLKNGSICYSLPAGKTGIYLRTFALDFLYIDEAPYVPDPVYTALKPMLAVSSKKGLGWECFLGTPFGKGGFFYDSHSSDDYKQWHISSEDCVRIPKEFLLKEKKRLTRIEYAQEYLGEFIDEFQQFFPTALIKKRMTFMRWNHKEDYKKNLNYFLGVDIARYGEDENGFVIAEMQDNNSLKIVAVEVTERKGLMDTVGRILALDADYKFNRVFIDDAGLGAGVFDRLAEKIGRRVIGLNNAKKSVGKKDWTPGMKSNTDDELKNKLLKEDLYSNASVMMETDGKIEIIDNLKLLKSLRSMTFEYTSEKNLKIYGKYSHLAEAFVRVCWAVKEKGLNIFLY